MKKRIVLIVIFMSVLILIILTCPLTVKTDKVIQGMEYRIGDATYAKSRSIKIKGTYCNYLIRRDTFEGIIEIEGYDITFDAEPKAIFNDNKFIVYFSKNADVNSTDMLPLDYLGYMLCTPDFDKVVFGITESGGWSGRKGLFLCGNVGNREEALEMARELASKNKWSSQIIWK